MGAFSVKVVLKTPGKDGVVAVRIPCFKVRCQLPKTRPNEVMSMTCAMTPSKASCFAANRTSGITAPLLAK